MHLNVDKMASDAVEASDDSCKMQVKHITGGEKKCSYCKKDVVNMVQCVKCREIFHPACIKQAAQKKTAVCRHETGDFTNQGQAEVKDRMVAVSEPIGDSLGSCLEVEVRYLKKLVCELEHKNRILEENCSLLREKVSLFEKIEVAKSASILLSGSLCNRDNGVRQRQKKHSESDPSTVKTVSFAAATRATVDAGDSGASGSGCQVDDTGDEVPSSRRRHGRPVIRSGDCSDITTVGSSVGGHSIDSGVLGSVDFDKQTGSGVNVNTETKNTDIARGQSGHRVHGRSAGRDRGGSASGASRRAKTNSNFKRDRENVATNRPEPLRGSAVVGGETSGGLLVAKQRSWFFLSGLDSSVEAEDVISYCGGRNIQDCTCTKMKTRRDKHVSSFKLGVPLEHREAVYQPQMWPTGAIINHFINVRRNP